MKKSKKIIFFGNEQIATGIISKAPIFKYLVDNYEVKALVISEKDSKKVSSVEKIALENSIEIINTPNISTKIDYLKSLDADIGILVAYGRIVPEKLINAFPAKIVNLHPSLLPLHRGSIPVESVILNGDSETGISLMELAPEMDAGPIYIQEKIELNGDETKQSLADKLIEVGLKSIKNNLDSIIDGKIQPLPQNNNDATYDNRINKKDAIIDWTQSSSMILNKIRAYQGWPGSECKLNDLRVKIISAKIHDSKGIAGDYQIMNGGLIIFTSDSSVELLEIQPDGKKAMSTKSFLAGYKDRI